MLSVIVTTVQYHSESLNHAGCASLQPFVTIGGDFPDYLGILSAVSLRSALGLIVLLLFIFIVENSNRFYRNADVFT